MVKRETVFEGYGTKVRCSKIELQKLLAAVVQGFQCESCEDGEATRSSEKPMDMHLRTFGIIDSTTEIGIGYVDRLCAFTELPRKVNDRRMPQIRDMDLQR